jgi:hypothetical protein
MEALLSLILPITALLAWVIGLWGIIDPNFNLRLNVWVYQRWLVHMESRPHAYSRARIERTQAFVERCKNPSRFATEFRRSLYLITLSIAVFLTVIFVIAWLNV